MSEEKQIRLSKALSELNISRDRAIEDLAKANVVLADRSPNAKISEEAYQLLKKLHADSAAEKAEAHTRVIGGSLASATETRPAPKPRQEVPEVFQRRTAPPVGNNRGPENTPNNKPEPVAEVAAAPQEKVVPAPVEPVVAKAPEPVVERETAPTQTAEEPKAEVKPTEATTTEAKPKAIATDKVDAANEAKEPSKEEPVNAASNDGQANDVGSKPGLTILGKIDLTKPEPAKSDKKGDKPAKSDRNERPKAKQEPPKDTKPKFSEPKPRKVEQAIQPRREDPRLAALPTNQASESPDAAPESDIPNEVIQAKAEQLKGLTVLGKITLTEEKKPGKPDPNAKKGKRTRIQPGGGQQGGTMKRVDADPNDRRNNNTGNRPGYQGQGGNRPGGGPGGNNNRPGQNRGRGGSGLAGVIKPELSDKEIQEQIKNTLARLTGGKGGNSRERKRERRNDRAAAERDRITRENAEAQILRVTEFASVADIAALMDVSVNEVIRACMQNGMFVSINQRLDAESIQFIALEFGFEVVFSSAEEELEIIAPDDVAAGADDTSRAPIVTIMGHVDHGKTSLLDYIRKAKVAAGEAGGITQHIGAYEVKTNTGQQITFLDTPGHEAFTAMRARGAKVTDVVILVVAADDGVMPQTKEAINHAMVAGVPIVIAINKMDKPSANPERIKQELAELNVLVEDWGGKYQCQPVSAKTGEGIDELLEKVVLEAEVLDLKANYDRRAIGTVIEAMLDKGRGYVATLLVQNGSMQVGDVLLVGPHYGRIKAMNDHRGQRIKVAGPATPVQVLGLDGAPAAGERFNVMENEREAREIATKRSQLMREQSIRTRKHITLDEIGRRLAIGSFKELNLIIKGDVDGSIEALADSLLKLSTPEVQVNILHKAVGQISESDVLLATASDAIIVGFQVRPSAGARKLAENEEIEIRLYSIIYNAIEEIKDAMAGLLAPKTEEVITGSAEVRQVFRISKVGSVAGCMVLDGYIKRNNPVRVIRDGIVVYSGELGALKRFKDDVAEVKQGFDCGMSIKSFNDFKESDIFESYEIREVKRTL